ncbi:MAG: hypothetical protein V4722_10850 [Bacteroidota bacterium]
MNRIVSLAAVFTLVLFFTSLSQGKPVPDYEFPEAMPEDVRKEYLKEFNKGKILYQINCGKCHNKTVKGKLVAPDFTPEQVANYEIRLANPKHQASLIEDKLLPEELGQITIFFTYKKKQASR